tara:strand:+ start:474 stop:719 length:246 start_codon:yes stop_codon:yes gene_type:complete
MINYFIYTLIALILIFVFIIAIRAVNLGIKAKTKNSIEKDDILLNENNNLTQKLENLSNLYKSGSITEEEFKIAKKKILEM